MGVRTRRDRRSHRYVEWQVALFFLAAGIWVGAMIVGRPRITGAAVVVLFVALLLGVHGRRLAARQDEDEDGSMHPVERSSPDGDA